MAAPERSERARDQITVVVVVEVVVRLLVDIDGEGRGVVFGEEESSTTTSGAGSVLWTVAVVCKTSSLLSLFLVGMIWVVVVVAALSRLAS
jgi:hypothetical protein